MGATAQLSHLGDTAPIDLDVLDEELRRGQLPVTARLRYAPWTGDRFLPLADIPQLADARDAPHARLAERLRAGPFPILSAAVTLVVATLGGLQALVFPAWDRFGQAPEAAVEALTWMSDRGITGLGPLLLDGAWWSPWTSQVLHDGPNHLFPNLAVLGYCGYRVERALGRGGYAVVLAAAVSLSSLAIALLEPRPVMGSSLAGYGLLGAQIAVGFRFAGALPPGRRGPYAFANIAIVAVLFVGGLGVANASHTGHVFGLIGGSLAALFVRAESLAPAAEERRVRRRNLLWAAALALAPGVLGAALGRVPLLAFGAPEEVALLEQGITLQVPARHRAWLDGRPEPGASADPLLRGGQRMVRPDFGFRVQGLPAWSPTPEGVEAVYAGRHRLRAESWGQDPFDAASLADRFGAQRVRELPAPEPLGEGWTAIALHLEDDEAAARVVEHHKLEGLWLARLGWILPAEQAGGPREAAFRAMVRGAVVDDPPELARAREDWEAAPRSARRELDYAVALYRAGRVAEADERFAAVIERAPRRAEEAGEWRAEMWARSGALEPGVTPSE